MRDCRYFDSCSVPLCPKDDGAAVCVWFLDEEMCRCSGVPEWVKRQRRMRRRTAAGFCFTLAMLAHECRISKNMKGIEPNGIDTERAADEKAWFAAHPLITAQVREKYRAIGFKKGVDLRRKTGLKNEKQAGSFDLPS
jgi:hypothetical protein